MLNLKSLFRTYQEEAVALSALQFALNRYETNTQTSQFICINLMDHEAASYCDDECPIYVLRRAIEHHLDGNTYEFTVAPFVGKQDDPESVTEEEAHPYRIAFIKQMIAELQ